MKRNLLIILSIVFALFVSCATYTSFLHNEYDVYYTEKQIDSVCQIERIPYIGEGWKQSSIINEWNNTYMNQHFYVRDMDSIIIVYIATDLDSIYKFRKRITKKVKQ